MLVLGKSGIAFSIRTGCRELCFLFFFLPLISMVVGSHEALKFEKKLRDKLYVSVIGMRGHAFALLSHALPVYPYLLTRFCLYTRHFRSSGDRHTNAHLLWPFPVRNALPSVWRFTPPCGVLSMQNSQKKNNSMKEFYPCAVFLSEGRVLCK